MRANIRFYLVSLLIILFWTSLEIAGAIGRGCFRGAALAPQRSCPTC